jgi:drug/metabolite transporter (DMT)-like permease
MSSVVTVGVVLAVLLAGLLHAIWNAIAKSVTDQWTSFTLLNVGVTVPCVLALPVVGVPVSAAWPYLVASVICHLGYVWFLMAAYRFGSLSRTYPIARGVAPMLVALGGLVFAGEHIGTLAFAGIVLVVLGVSSLAALDWHHASAREVLWSLATGAAIATYTVIDGLGVRASHNPLSYTVTLFALQGASFLAVSFVRRTGRHGVTSRMAVLGVTAGVLSLVSYGIVLWAQTKAPLGVVSALRETGVIWAAVIGVYLFKERGGPRVVGAGAVVLAGVVAMSLA